MNARKVVVAASISLTTFACEWIAQIGPSDLIEAGVTSPEGGDAASIDVAADSPPVDKNLLFTDGFDAWGEATLGPWARRFVGGDAAVALAPALPSASPPFVLLSTGSAAGFAALGVRLVPPPDASGVTCTFKVNAASDSFAADQDILFGSLGSLEATSQGTDDLDVAVAMERVFFGATLVGTSVSLRRSRGWHTGKITVVRQAEPKGSRVSAGYDDLLVEHFAEGWEWSALWLKLGARLIGAKTPGATWQTFYDDVACHSVKP